MKKTAMVAIAVGSLMLSGCAFLGYNRNTEHTQNSTSLVDFLYPQGRLPDAATQRPQLKIPLRVGLAFLPSAAGATGSLDAAHREMLLERIRQRFASRAFVSDIVLVPDYYLAGQRGFSGLEGLQRLYGVDVIALVSFDQQTHEDRNEWSLAYLSIVGQYVVKGSRHDVSTLIDLAVVDPQTRTLVIRAGGTDVRHGNTTLVDAARETRKANLTGFSGATDQMIDHFDTALTAFEASVRSGTAPVSVVSKNGGSVRLGGGGAFNMPFIGLLLLVLARRRVAMR